jgi:ribosomal protein L24E
MTWQEIERRWHDTGVINCDLCGKLIPRRLWVVEIEGRELRFCSEDCERLYRTYWLPKYGTTQHTEEPA